MNKVFFYYPICFWLLIISTFSFVTYQRNLIWETPLLLWSDTAKKNHTSAKVYNGLGNAYADLKDYSNAILIYNKALLLAPEWYTLYFNMGMMLSHRAFEKKDTEDIKKAIQYFEITLKLNPSAYLAYNSIAMRYYMLQDYEKAVQYLKEGIKVNPNFPPYYSNMAVILYTGYGKKEESIKHLQMAISMDPDMIIPDEIKGLDYSIK